MRKFFALMLALMMALSLVACGGETAAEDPTPEANQTDQQGETAPEVEEEPEEPAKVLEPIVYTGSGDDVLEIASIADGYVFHITGNEAKDLFIVTGYDAAGNETEMLCCSANPYDGVTTDYTCETTTLEIEASGDWTVELIPMAALPRYKQGDTITGCGDYIFYADSVGKTADITGNKAKDLFIITAFDENEGDMIVCESDPYEGTVMLKNNPFYFVVEAVDEWSITLN